MKRKLEQQLVKWKNSENRMPLIVSGARQVGKTWLLEEFAASCYENYIRISLDINQRAAAYFKDSTSPQQIISLLQAEYGQRINPRRTLIILDEIQSCERALASLKHFCEEAPEYHIASAGSLLGVAVNREEYSFPVGKVNIYPMDFEEFLWAMGDELLADEIRAAFATLKPLNEGLHLKALQRLREYYLVGGMPACVNAYAGSADILLLPDMQNEIVNNYLADMAKYASTADTVKIRACYNSLPAQLAKENTKFQYRIVQKGGTASRFDTAIEWLDLAGITLRSTKTSQGLQPITTHIDASSFKLYMADTGLLSMKSGLRQTDVLSDSPHHFKGALAENYVAQQLAAQGYELCYWASASTAELDFVIQSQQGVTAIEVKSGGNTRSKSLASFVKRFQPQRAIRLSTKPFGSGGGMMAIPLYAAFCV
jgi:predicted AAA+ superfamily ATPase